MLATGPLRAGNFYAGTSPANVSWPGGVVPYEFTNTLTAAQQQTYLDGLREWELAANVKFVPRTNQTHWILFTYNTIGFDNVSVGTNPQVVSVSSLSRAQVGHEMGHSFGFTHENIRPDQTNYLLVLSNNITSGNLGLFQMDPASVTNGAYDFESVMHLGWDFASTNPGVTPTQQPKPPYFPRYQFRMGNLTLSPGDRAALRYLYGPPAVPLTNVVTTTADSGPGSLRAALYYVADNPGTMVRFNIPASDPGYSNGVFNLRLTGHLPVLATNGMVIDGSTQPGFAGKPLIVVDGSQIIPETFTSNSGLLIYSANNQVKNISFHGFNWNGLTLEYADATNNTIAGCWLGPDATGSNAAPNAHQGIFLVLGAGHNIIGGTNATARNVISGNLEYGLWMSDTNTTGNLILGNYIGTDAGGRRPLANGKSGVIIGGGAGDNTIGGTNAFARNLLSGNTEYGIYLTNTAGNTILGNYIGTDVSGSNTIPNGFSGLILDNNSRSNVIGGPVATARNLVSGNVNAGIWVTGPGTSGNTVQGNWAGLNAAGNTALPNTFIGMYLIGGAQGNLVLGNVFSGHASEGLRISDPGTSANVVQGNFFGTDAGGLNSIPNNYAGLNIFSGASANTIGGPTVAARNLISGNYYNVVIDGASSNLIQGNFIGTDISGTNGLGYTFLNVVLWNGSANNVVGGTGAGAGNVIAFASGSGVAVYDPGTTNNSIRGNSISGNNALGIDLVDPGDVYPYVTPNDPGDADPGPNDLQNFPIITNAFGFGTSTIILGKLNSLAGRSFFIDVYRNVAADLSGYGEGQFYVGSVSVTTDGSGNALFAGTNNSGNYAGQYLTATATSAGGDTSEFGPAVLATNKPAPSARFTGPLIWRTNGFVLTLALQTNFGYRLQAATNLASPVVWIDLTNYNATSSSLTFTDRTVTNFRTRFYRAISP